MVRKILRVQRLACRRASDGNKEIKRNGVGVGCKALVERGIEGEVVIFALVLVEPVGGESMFAFRVGGDGSAASEAGTLDQ